MAEVVCTDSALRSDGFAGECESVSRDAVAQDAGTWARARAWALWKALITYDTVDSSHQGITEVLADHRAQG